MHLFLVKGFGIFFMKNRIVKLMESAVRQAAKKGLIPDVRLPYIEVEVPANSEHGDYASNVALILASQARQNPRKIAEIIQANLVDGENIIAQTKIAGPGFLNIYVKDSVWYSTLQEIAAQKGKYGRIAIGEAQKVQVEFVSANPTGPLHIGHARGAVVGDVIANLLKCTGYHVDKEYYINDAGNQMNNLGKSVLVRYRELLGEQIQFPENCYQGNYIREIAREIIQKGGNKYLTQNEEDTIQYFTEIAAI